MLVVGVTGGIGSGKSTVASLLAARGAVVLDADALAREAIDVGTPGLASVVDRFGRDILDASGGVDRRRLAEIVFADDGARRDLEAIVHPEVARRIAEGVAEHAGGDRIVVVDSPLLLEAGRRDAVQVLVVVTAPEDVRVERVVRERGMAPAEVRARIEAQMPADRQVAHADIVVRNDGSIDDLRRDLDGLWSELRAREALAS
jgi:dephospho-CoA kinase